MTENVDVPAKLAELSGSTVFLFRGSAPGLQVMPGDGALALFVFTSEAALAGVRRDAAWQSTTGEDLLDQLDRLPDGVDLLVDPGTPEAAYLPASQIAAARRT